MEIYILDLNQGEEQLFHVSIFNAETDPGEEHRGKEVLRIRRPQNGRDLEKK